MSDVGCGMSEGGCGMSEVRSRIFLSQRYFCLPTFDLFKVKLANSYFEVLFNKHLLQDLFFSCPFFLILRQAQYRNKSTKKSRLYRNFTHLYTSVNTRKTRLDSLGTTSWEQVKLCFATHMPTRFTFGYICVKFL